MERAELASLTLEELRAQARRRSVPDADTLSREELIERLCEADESGLLGRARKLVRRAAERLLPTASPGTSTTARPARPKPAREPTETETVARLYENQGHFDKALAIYRRMLARDPARTDLSERIRALEARRTAPPHAPGPGPASVEPQAPAEPFGMLDYEEPPETYGVDEVAVLPQDPWHLFVYWEVTADGRASARSQLGTEGHAAQLVLRLASVRALKGDLERDQRDLELDWDHGRRYLKAPWSGARVSVAVGLRTPSGRFAPIAHSPAVLVPPAQPAPPGPVEWMQVAAPQRRDGELEPIVVVARGKERL
ncbi:MAG TPA: DUF4912 domain-containing protein, partial [Polyangia bacterium]|nr:DUF4912 domain-containing protein [Polyangia bacterium]